MQPEQPHDAAMTVASPILPRWRDRRGAKIVATAVALVLLTVSGASAQQFALSSADLADSAALATSTRRLAGEVLASYRDPDRGRYLDNVFRLQILLGRFAEASTSLAELRTLRQHPVRSRALRPVRNSGRRHARRRGRRSAEGPVRAGVSRTLRAAG
jgi:hypothetical protein